MKKALIIVSIWWALITCTAFAGAGDTLMTHIFGGNDYDFASSIQQTIEGGFIISGTTYSFDNGAGDMYLLKLNTSGDTIWTRTFGGSGYEKGASVQQAIDGGFILLGDTESFGAGMQDIYLVRTRPDGDTIWTRTFGGAADEYASSVIATSDGDFILAGYTNSFGAGNFDMYFLKVDPYGNLMWSKTFGGNSHDEARSIDVAEEGYILAGATRSFGAGQQDFYLMKTDYDGNEIWSQTYGGSGFESGRSVKHTSDGGYIIAGYTDSYGAGSTDVFLVKTNSYGHAEWTRTFGGPSLDLAFSVQETLDRGYIIAGHSVVDGFYGDAILIKTDDMGNMRWGGMYGGDYQDVAYSVVQSNDGNYIFIGDTNSYGQGLMDIFMIKVFGDQQTICCDVNMAPDTYPLAVPPGGSFGLTGIIGNPTPEFTNTDVWVGIWYENIFFQLASFPNIPLNSGQYFSAHMIQQVPDFAPFGTYRYAAYCGDKMINDICDSSYFSLVVTGNSLAWGANDWTLMGGWNSEPETIQGNRLLNNFPNPFNSSTDIVINLTMPSEVTLAIYNMLGQKVTELAEGWMDAGTHRIAWDASTASSGIYFCKLRAGKNEIVKKMSLLK